MASITKQANGRKMIQFITAAGKRKSLRLGVMSMKTAEAFKTKVESLVAASLSRLPLDDETSRWLGTLDSVMLGRLATVGLVPGRAKIEMPTLAAFIDGYIAKRTDCQPGTIRNYKQARREAVTFFGTTKRLDEVTSADAEDWRRALLAKGLAENTIRSFAKCAKSIGRYAVDKELLARNPFGGLKGGTLRDESRLRFITKQETERLIAACPDAEWRLLVALGRYGGLRTPSETNALRWDGIDWEHDRITVVSPKTGTRMLPLFPELRPLLADAFDQAPAGAEYVIGRYRDQVNMRTRMLKIMARAGLAWPKPFQNLRASRQTELTEIFPSHVVCQWLGNSEAVAKKHYLQVTDEHFRRAATTPESALQNPMQQAAEPARNESQATWAAHKKSPALPSFAIPNIAVRNDLVPLRGFEPRLTD